MQPDAASAIETAIVSRLAGNWGRRATVKKAEPDLGDLFDPAKPDYPFALTPFHHLDGQEERFGPEVTAKLLHPSTCSCRSSASARSRHSPLSAGTSGCRTP